MNDFIPYLTLAYVAQTVSRATSRLIPIKSGQGRHLAQQWTATATAVALSYAARIDLLADVGLDVGSDAIGYILTGVLLGHGVHYAVRFLSHAPDDRRNQNPPE